MPRAAWGLAVLLVVGAVGPVTAQPAPLAPTGGPPDQRPALAFDPSVPGPPPADLPPSRGPITGAPVTGAAPAPRPPSVLGAPVMGLPVHPAAQDPVTPVGYPDAAATAREPDRDELRPSRRTAVLGAPVTSATPVAARVIEPTARTSYTPPAVDPVDDLLARRGRERDGDRPAPRRADDSSSGKFWEGWGEKLSGALGQRDGWFKSDHCFDGFISPVTNPFLFEDPRSVTEVRPIFMYQQIPSSQPDFAGGNIWFFGTQARVAFTNRLSLVVNKLGGLSINPGSGSTFDSSTGFAELWLGPKYTIIRGEDSGSLLAGGLQFQVPVGSAGTFQNTGTLSLVPYLTYGKNFLRDMRFGSLNALIGTGYSVSVNNQRSDYYYLSAHLDLDVMNNHRFYPLAEMNWFLYTTNGTTTAIGSEGRDLFNLGAAAKGNGFLTGAVGARYKISESAQIGGAFEFPLAGPKDLFRYRFTLDFILRY